jgi:hypothetical protein
MDLHKKRMTPLASHTDPIPDPVVTVDRLAESIDRAASSSTIGQPLARLLTGIQARTGFSDHVAQYAVHCP